ncbi:MAG TPA: T9SS type A sorting domain-containing protein, partial [Flavobacterium sp.]|nr:T9SS type A sorting domain-containing protein [Flavobacterium sp.]
LADFKLYPNPTSDRITVSFSSETMQDVTFKLYDYTGREIQSQTVQNSGQVETVVDLSQVSTGVYLLTIKDGSHTVTKQVVKN